LDFESGYLGKFGFYSAANGAFVRGFAFDGIAAYLTDKYLRLWEVRTGVDGLKSLGVGVVVDLLHRQSNYNTAGLP
jgi:hypothetical protein